MGGQELLDLRGHFDGMLLMRRVACLGKDRQLCVWQFTMQDPLVLQWEERISIARNDQSRLVQVLQFCEMAGFPLHERADELRPFCR